MTDDQLKTLLTSEYILQNVRMRPDVNLAKIDPPNLLTGYVMTFDKALGLWAIVGLLSTTHIAAADVISLQFSNTDKVGDRAAA
jgi:hypothetical protein